MNSKILIFISILNPLAIFSQHSPQLYGIDSIVATNEKKVSKIFQEIEKSKIEVLHGRSPENFSRTYRYAGNNTLLSATFTSYSIGDTDIIVSYYFDSGNLIKGTVISFDFEKKRTEYTYYFSENELINKEVGLSGIFSGDYFITRAAGILKGLKKRPIRFPP